MKNNKLVYVLFLLTLCMATLISGCSKDGSARNPIASDRAEDESLSRGENSDEIVLGTLVPLVNLKVQSDRHHIGDEITLLAEAVDPSGGILEFDWTASTGVFVNKAGHQALWQAPDFSTKALLTCKVTDMRGQVGSATVEIDVLGKTSFKIKLLADASSLFVNDASGGVEGYVPLAGARVGIEGTGIYEQSDTSGMVNLSLTPELMGKLGLIRLSYKNWDIAYETLFPARDGDHREDELVFTPSFEGATVAMGRGDSFVTTYGMVEVRPVENRTDLLKPIEEVRVSVGDSTVNTNENVGRIAVSASRFGTDTDLRISKGGYMPMEDLKVPLAPSQTTIVQARLVKNGESSGVRPFISYIKPYSGKTGVGLWEPLEIGFGQPMNINTAFDDFEMLVFDKGKNSIVGVTGSDLEDKFFVDWPDSYRVLLTPKEAYDSDSTYAISIKKWNAYAADGRLLRDYSGLYREFVTLGNPEPRISSIQPSNGSIGVRRSAIISFIFNVEMRRDSIYQGLNLELFNKSDNITLKLNGTNLEEHFEVTWSNGGKVLELMPIKPLAPHAEFVLKINSFAPVSVGGKTLKGINNTWHGFTTSGL